VLASLEGARRAEFEAELLDVFRRYNRAKDGSAAVESTCMRVLAIKI
jgi:hypothetical protein